jgi:hypothetical protein
MGEPALHVYDEDSQPPDHGPALWEILPKILDDPEAERAPDTIAQYKRAVRLWTCFDRGLGFQEKPDYESPRNGTVDTGARLIDAEMLRKFREWMIANAYAPSTYNKTMRYLRPLLRKLSPAVTGNPEGMGVIDRVPAVKVLKEKKKTKRRVSLDQLDSLYRSAADMVWPEDDLVRPADAWRALLVILFNLGARTWTEAASLPADAVCLDEESPHDAIDFDAPHGWVYYMPEKTKRYDRRACLPMSATVRMHLEPIAVAIAGTDRERLLTFGENKKLFYFQWKRLCEFAGLGVAEGERNETGSDLRKTCAATFNTLDGRKGQKLGRWMLGHAEKGTHERHYDIVMPELIQAVQEISQPPAFSELFAKPIERQLRLF